MVSDVTTSSAAGPSVLESVLDCTHDAVVLLDREGVVSLWNGAAERMLGISPESGLGLDYAQLFAPERRDEVRELVLGTSPGRPRRATAVALRTDGTRLIVEAACAAFRAADEQASGFVVVLRDVTEAMLVRSAASAVAFEADASTALTSFSKVLEEIVPVENLTLTAVEGDDARRVASGGRSASRLPSGELLALRGSPLETAIENRRPLVCPDTRAGPLRFDRLLARRGVGSYVVLPLFRSGRVIAALNIGFAAADVPTAAVVGLLTSLTALIMPIILNLVTLQEREVAIQRLEEVDRLRNEFLALMTHEIRTPLAIIAGFAEQLQNSWDVLSEAEKLESVEMIHRNGRNLSRLVEDGLQIARIESGQFDYELVPVDLAEEARRVVADFTHEDAGRIRVSAAPRLPRALCDPQRHRQILTNLVSNALRFSPPETPIHVGLTRRGSTVQVHVRDRGPGIARADLPKLFRKFSRVGGPEQLRVAGTGLGLYISKAIVEAQGGRIRVRSKPGSGSTFTYTLPVADPDDG